MSDAPDPATVVAIVEGQAITLAQLEEPIRGQLLALERSYAESVHQLRRETLDEMIDARLLVEESLRRGITTEELQEAETAVRTTPVTDEELEAFYAENAARIQGSLEEVRVRLRGYLERTRAAAAKKEFVASLREAAGVEVLLAGPELPRVRVAATGPSRGPVDAPVTLVTFSEFQCPYCAEASQVLSDLSVEYGDRLRIVFRDFPLPSHPLAQKAGEAAQCANEQGRFWDMHDRLYAHPEELDVPALRAHARALGLDGDAFDECLDSGRMAQIVLDNREAGRAVGVTATPAFFVNGRFLSGAKPAEAFRRMIDAELAGDGS